MTEQTTKQWYKKWWGLILAIIFWPLFVMWFAFARSKNVGVRIAFTILGLLGILVTVILLIGIASSSSQPAPKTATSSLPVTKTTKPTATAAEIKTQVTPILTAATKKYTDMEASVVAASSESDAGTASGQSNKLKQQLNTTADNSVTTAYNTANNLYYKHGLAIPASLDSWSLDDAKLYTDAAQLATDEYSVAADVVLGTDATKDKAAVATDLATYDRDVTKTNNDIATV